MPRNKRLHFKDLDALKFIMLLPVLLYCSMLSIQPQGEGITVEIAGASKYFLLNSIDFYFFLSAFFLASHALREIKYKSDFSLKNFYVRRVLRISFFLVISLVFVFLFHPWIARTLKLFEFETPTLMPFITGIPNYIGDLNGTQDSVLVIIWGLFMFLQFYAVIGIVLKYLVDKIIWVGIALIVAGVIARLVLIMGEADILFNTLSYSTPIGFGLILAKLVREDNRIIGTIKGFSKTRNSIIYIILSIHLLTAYLLSPKYVFALIPLLSGLLFSFVVLEQTYGKNSLFKFRKNKTLSRLGKISLSFLTFYGMLSIVTFIAIESVNLDLLNVFIKIAMMLATFILAWLFGDLCFNYIEQPIRSVKRDFKRE